MATARISVFDPNGQEGTIPVSQSKVASAKGYRAIMYDKSGQKGSVPFEQMAQATRAGYTTTPKTQFEQQRTPQGSAFGRAAKAAGGDLAGVATGFGDLISGDSARPGAAAAMGARAALNYGLEKQEGYGPGYRTAALIGQGAGIINPEGMEESAAQGDMAGVAGHVVVPALGAALAIPKVREGIGSVASGAAERIGDVRGRVGESIRTPEGKLRPLPRTVARIGGAAAGYASHVPEGGLIGALTGPTVLESIFPDPNAEMRARGAFMNRGYRPASEGGAPRRIGAPSDPGVTLFPEPRPEFEGETPNYMASVPRDELPDMAARGKPGAGRQLQQLGEPVLYIPRAEIGGGSGFEDFRNNLIGANAGLPPSSSELIGAGAGEGPDVGLGPRPFVTAKTLSELPNETPEEAARRRYMSAQIRRNQQQ